METTTTKTAGMFAPVIPNSSGFGMYHRGEVQYCWPDPANRNGNGQEDIDAFIDASRDNGYYLARTWDIDGMIENQNGAAVFEYINDNDETTYCLLWTEGE